MNDSVSIKQKDAHAFFLFEHISGNQWRLIDVELATDPGTACDFFLGLFFERFKEENTEAYGREKQKIAIAPDPLGCMLGATQTVESRNFSYIYSGW